MENSSFSPVSPVSPGDRGEILTPGQRGGGDPPPSTPPPAATPPEGHPPSYDAVLNIELAKSLLRTLERKNTNVKAKGSRPPSAAPSPMAQSGGSAHAVAAATPSTSTHHMQGNHHGTVPPHPYSAGMFPPPNPHHGLCPLVPGGRSLVVDLLPIRCP